MSYFRECPDCGAKLDPGEKCDCKRTGNIISLLEAEEAKKHGLSAEAMNELEAVFGKELNFAELLDRFAGFVLYGEAPKREDEPKKEAEKPLTFYGVKEVAELLGCSIPTAREIMKRSDFPCVKVEPSPVK